VDKEQVIATLKTHEPELRHLGILHAALFGSVARGDNRPDSDIDIMIEVNPEAHITVFDYVGLKEYIASLFSEPVDVVDRGGLKPYIRPAATADALYAF
jgi:predicted nucleotidyltransferase